MKKLIILIAFMLAVMNVAAQQNPLNQAELLKKIHGVWECRLGTNTVLNYQYEIFGSGMAGIIVVTAGGEVQDSAIQLFGYDAQKDVIMLAELVNTSSKLEIKTLRFTTDTTGVITSSAPDDTRINVVFEFLGPKVMKQTAVLENKYEVKMLFNKKDTL